ncbi:MAG: transposase [Candidatus Brocadiaceae bacterium]|uniref:transposase n=1 Tax=Candidatus Wunengus sp. YC61 TaxID=3367698 RepID=UPI002729389E|nr:transposase [Candidatus Brocadiaceae bacterium]
MKVMENDTVYYRRNMPHIQPNGAAFFVTFRLAGSLPKEVVLQLKEEQSKNERLLYKVKNETERKKKIDDQRKLYFGKFDEILDKATSGPCWLKDERIVKVVADAIRLHDKKEFDLLAYCIMPNHVHLVFTVRHDYIPSVRAEARATSTTSHYIMTDILRLIKGATAREANKILNRTGAFWQHESYDRVVRDEKELNRIIWYTINNPVKAGLVKNADDWKWSYYANVE